MCRIAAHFLIKPLGSYVCRLKLLWFVSMRAALEHFWNYARERCTFPQFCRDEHNESMHGLELESGQELENT
jgi:hypothetical protein